MFYTAKLDARGPGLIYLSTIHEQAQSNYGCNILRFVAMLWTFYRDSIFVTYLSVITISVKSHYVIFRTYNIQILQSQHFIVRSIRSVLRMTQCSVFKWNPIILIKVIMAEKHNKTFTCDNDIVCLMWYNRYR
jgi:hypothetical protein